jgi:peptidoglycan/LPS O-acetylase OafA/YrhL
LTSSSRTRTPQVRFTDSWASVHFDLLRGLAAIFVLLEHWRNIFFLDFPQLIGHRTLFMVPYILSGAGHQSVVFFFVLSGYFIGGTVFRALERDQWQWSGYLLRRFARLWTVLVPALLLCLFWDRLGLHLGHAPSLYGGQAQNHMIPDVAPLLAPHIFFGNLFFLQNIITPVFGSNGALWSLANEFWYYILFPLGLVALWRRATWRHRLLCAVLFAATAWFVRGGILMNFPLWLAGAVLFKLPAPSFSVSTGKYLRIVATLIYFPIFFVLGRLHQIPGLLGDYLLGVLTFLLLWIFLSHKQRFVPEARTVRASRELARFSYTLYAVHTPLLVFIASVTVGDSRWYPTTPKILLALGILIATLVYAYVLAFLTEFRTDALRLRLERLFRMDTTPPALPSNPLSELAHPLPVAAETHPKVLTSLK